MRTPIAVTILDRVDIVLYDGTCGLCHGGVRWLVARDGPGRLHYAPLQGTTAEALRARHPGLPLGLEAMVLVTRGRVHAGSAAAVRIAARLPWPWKLLAVGWIVPAPLRDLLYRLVAGTRYRLFGRADLCDLPEPEARARFLP